MKWKEKCDGRWKENKKKEKLCRKKKWEEIELRLLWEKNIYKESGGMNIMGRHANAKIRKVEITVEPKYWNVKKKRDKEKINKTGKIWVINNAGKTECGEIFQCPKVLSILFFFFHFLLIMKHLCARVRHFVCAGKVGKHISSLSDYSPTTSGNSWRAGFVHGEKENVVLRRKRETKKMGAWLTNYAEA